MHIHFPANKKAPNPKSYKKLETGCCSVPLLSPVVIYLSSIRAELSQSGHRAGIYRTSGEVLGAQGAAWEVTGALGHRGLSAVAAVTAALQRRPTARPPHAGPRGSRPEPGGSYSCPGTLPAVLCGSLRVRQPRRQQQPALLAPPVAGRCAPGLRGAERGEGSAATSEHPPDAPRVAGEICHLLSPRRKSSGWVFKPPVPFCSPILTNET